MKNIFDDKEEDGWLCMNPFCSHAESGRQPKFCPRCGAKHLVKVRGYVVHKTQTYWQPTKVSIKEAIKEELKDE